MADIALIEGKELLCDEAGNWSAGSILAILRQLNYTGDADQIVVIIMPDHQLNDYGLLDEVLRELGKDLDVPVAFGRNGAKPYIIVPVSEVTKRGELSIWLYESDFLAIPGNWEKVFIHYRWGIFSYSDKRWSQETYEAILLGGGWWASSSQTANSIVCCSGDNPQLRRYPIDHFPHR